MESASLAAKQKKAARLLREKRRDQRANTEKALANLRAVEKLTGHLDVETAARHLTYLKIDKGLQAILKD